MSQNKPAFTPGPWKMADLAIYDSDKDWLASVDTFSDGHLIAAAPELYEALEGLVEMYVDLVSSGDCGHWDPEKEMQVIAARAALAKARGEAQ